ncbi:MAG: HAMP domain-containing sensor histidine kinase [Candidatus Margulisiibacteriota bacterium]|nr:HAMP domain-containing sensor histidine kinase [Candidatus Margulisiibacteriota bacterium]
MSQDILLIWDIKNKFYSAILVRYATVAVIALLFAIGYFLRMDIRPGMNLLIFVTAYNLAAHLIYILKKKFELWQIMALNIIFLFFDVCAVTLLIYFTGWVESPYWFLYLILILVSGFGMFSYYSLSVFIIAFFSALFYLGLLLAFYLGYLPIYQTDLKLTPQEILISITNKSLFITLSFLIFAVTIYYFSKLLKQHRQALLKKNRELLEMLEEMKDINRLKDEFVANASHELRTPLSLIRENVSLVEDGIAGGIGEKQRKLLTSSRENIDRLVNILTNLLDLSRIENRSFALDLQKVDIGKIGERALTDMEIKAKNKNIKMTNKMGKGLTTWVDPEQIYRVFIILLDNAIKFTNENGEVEVGTEDLGEWIRCYVRDNGMGIEAKAIPRIFMRFVKFDETSKGTGLGLAICRGIVEMHGGEIRAESEPEKGSNFFFILPKGEKR